MISVNDRAILPYLFCFWHVTKSMSFTRAAETMSISQSAVSYQIKQLEELIGLELLERDKRSLVRLTPNGRMLHDECQDIFYRLNQTLDALKGNTLTGTVTVAAPTCFGSIILSELIAGLRSDYPEMKVHLRLADRHVDLRSEQIDMAFRTVSSGPGLHTQPILKVPMRLVASNDYVRIHGAPQSFEDLHNHNMIFTNARDRDWHSLREQITGVPLLSENVTYIDNVWGILHAIDTNMGLCYLPLYTVGDKLKSGEYASLLGDELKNAYLIIYLSSPYPLENNPKATAIKKALKAYLEHGRHLGLYYWLEALKDAP